MCVFSEVIPGVCVCVCVCRVNLLLGYRPEELLGRSVYQLCHPLDAASLARSHLDGGPPVAPGPAEAAR